MKETGWGGGVKESWGGVKGDGGGMGLRRLEEIKDTGAKEDWGQRRRGKRNSRGVKRLGGGQGI